MTNEHGSTSTPSNADLSRLPSAPSSADAPARSNSRDGAGERGGTSRPGSVNGYGSAGEHGGANRAGTASEHGAWEQINDDDCRRASAIVERIGRRWSSAILLALGRGATRFSEILARVDGLSDRMLAARLKELEQIGLIDRIVEPTTPVSVRYRLTERGQELLAALQPLARYGMRWESPRPVVPDV